MPTYSGVPGDSRCGCYDSACSPDHKGSGQCMAIATMILWRIDKDDVTGTAFCESCGEDAMGSGLFTDNVDPDEPEAEPNLERDRR